MKIEIIVPNFNGLELIKRNLPRIIKSAEKKPNTIITIVDDGSHIDEQKELTEFIEEVNKKRTKKVKLLSFQQNVGFSSNVNRAALVSDSDVLVLLNSDVAPDANFLDPLVSHFEDPEMFGVGCMDESIEEKKILRGRGIGEWKRGFVIHRRGEVDKTDTFWVSGGSSAYNTKLFQLLGGLDSLYNPFYWEDIDLSYRAQKAGYKIVFEPKSMVEHVHKKGSIKKHFKDHTIKSYAMRNQFTFIWKNITDLGLILAHILWLPYYLFRALLRWDTIFLMGFILAILRLPAIMKHRKIQSKQYKISDRTILKLS